MESTAHGASFQKALSHLNLENKSSEKEVELTFLEFILSNFQPGWQITQSETPSENRNPKCLKEKCYITAGDYEITHHLCLMRGVPTKSDTPHEQINGNTFTDYNTVQHVSTNIGYYEDAKDSSPFNSSFNGFNDFMVSKSTSDCCGNGTEGFKACFLDCTEGCYIKHSNDLATLFGNLEFLGNFLHYVFTRHFGLADKCFQTYDASNSPIYDSPAKKTDMELDVHKKLDILIQRLVKYPMTFNMVSAYADVLHNSSHLPIVRSKVMEHVMMWMASNSDNVNHELFQKVKSLIMTGAADMWSVVRKTCSNGLPKVFSHWTQKQQKHFLTALLEVCINKEGSWQSKDGAALCISSIMHHCYSPKNAGGLPDYVSECVLTVIFSLISHPQLCIRETVANTMSAYVEHVDAQDVKALLHQTLLLLMPSSGESDSKGNRQLQMAEAYTAEGLLNICISILKVLNINQALGLWPKYCNNFLACLAHDASSVRQTTSLLFTHLATRKDSSVVMVKLVLHRLSSFWNVGLDALACCQDFFEGDADSTGKWEATEGRMFVYELIFQQLIEDYISTQHNNVSQKSLADDIGHVESYKHTNGANLSCENKYEAVEECLCSMSWLAQLYLLDNTHLLARTLNLQEMIDKELYELQWWLLTHQTEKTEISDGCEAWYGDKILPSCPELFLTLLHQTAACLAHTQWELRRIAQQILPHLCEVIWLYSTDLMQVVWRYTTHETCLKSFLGLFMMRHSLAHCAAIVDTISLTDKDGTSSSSVNIDLVESVRKKIKDYLPLISSFLERPVFDKISVTAAEIALLSVTLFELEESLKMELSEAALNMWRSLFAFAHPSAVTMLVFSSLGTKFSSPSEGFLSCCLVRPENKLQCARQVEKTLLSAIHRLLPQFLPSVSVYNRVICLPILAHSVRLFIDDKNICRSLLTSLNILSHCTQSDFAAATNGETAAAGIRDSETLRCIFYTVWELAHSVAMKSLDQLLLQKVLGSYLLLCGFLDPAHHVPLVLKSICSRLNEGQLLPDDLTDRTTVLDVDLHWYIPAYVTSSGEPSFATENYDTNMPREKDDRGDSLNTSGRSLGSLSRLPVWRRRTLSITSSSLEIHKESDRCEDAEDSGESEEDGSDWDSWSEEEAEQTNLVLKTLFQDFLLHLRTMYGQAVEKILEAEREKMTQKDNSLLQDLITVNKNKCKG